MNTVKKTIVEPAKSTDSPEHAASAARCVCSCAHSATLPAVALLEIMRGRRGGFVQRAANRAPSRDIAVPQQRVGSSESQGRRR